VEHPPGAEDAAVAGGRGGGDDDETDDGGGGWNADMVEHPHERAGLDRQLVPGDERHDHRHRADVEDQDAPDHSVDGARQGPRRVARLARRDADQLDAAEGEGGDGQRQDHPEQAVREEAAMRP
jgi:hypothetical protein